MGAGTMGDWENIEAPGGAVRANRRDGMVALFRVCLVVVPLPLPVPVPVKAPGTDKPWQSIKRGVKRRLSSWSKDRKNEAQIDRVFTHVASWVSSIS